MQEAEKKWLSLRWTEEEITAAVGASKGAVAGPRGEKQESQHRGQPREGGDDIGTPLKRHSS